MTLAAVAPRAASRRRMVAAVGVAAAVGAIATVATFAAKVQGYALYHGFLSLPATIAGTGVALPVSASACVNCHEGAASGGPIAIARLDGSTLATARRRGGGAVMTYDRDGFCRVLREGVDPSLVTISRTMPRFEITERQCDALWAWTSER